MAFENGIIDLRSDTVTHPTIEMREAMATAKVGDDVYGEDPTINELEARSAQILGKEAGLFTASGTMGNLIAVLTHCARGGEAVMGNYGHTFLHEVGGISALGGVFPQLIPNQEDGTLALEDVKKAIREEDIHHPETQLFILENTQNSCGGIPVSADYIHSVSEIIKPKGINLHIDGARLFNAAVALNVGADVLVADADSVMFCLSKGLCAPVGSILCGSKEFISRARKIRKQLGGGMRQAGILGAAGLIAVEEMTKRLGDDHIRANEIAKALGEIDGIVFPKGLPLTNMVYIKLQGGNADMYERIIARCKQEKIMIGMSDTDEFRFVTHYWISDDDIYRFVSVLKTALSV